MSTTSDFTLRHCNYFLPNPSNGCSLRFLYAMGSYRTENPSVWGVSRILATALLWGLLEKDVPKKNNGVLHGLAMALARCALFIIFEIEKSIVLPGLGLRGIIFVVYLPLSSSTLCFGGRSAADPSLLYTGIILLILLLHYIIIIIIIIIIYRLYAEYLQLYISETNHASRVYGDAAILELQFKVHVMLRTTLNILYFYIITFRSTCPVRSMAVFCSSLISCFPDMLLRYFLN